MVWCCAANCAQWNMLIQRDQPSIVFDSQREQVNIRDLARIQESAMIKNAGAAD